MTDADATAYLLFVPFDMQTEIPTPAPAGKWDALYNLLNMSLGGTLALGTAGMESPQNELVCETYRSILVQVAPNKVEQFRKVLDFIKREWYTESVFVVEMGKCARL